MTTQTITKDSNIGELVATDYRTASVFKSLKIDFCCNGNRSIADACNDKKIQADMVIENLIKVTQEPEVSATDFNTWPLDLLADYIEKKHHRYVETKIAEIKPYLDRVSKVHGERHPELIEIKALFTGCAGELTMHMKKEELILFPFIKRMVESQRKGEEIENPGFGTVLNPIQMMMHEHENEGERFRKIEELSNQFTPPADACNTYRVSFALLKEFQADLHMHIHLENNILFPKAIELEKSLF